VCEEQGRVIVLEDDLATSPNFLRYMNDALNLYEDEPDVVSIHGQYLSNDVAASGNLLPQRGRLLGWATWKTRLADFNPDGAALLRELVTNELTDEFDFRNAYPYTQMLRDQLSGKVDSWAIRWYASAFLKNMLTLYPESLFTSATGTGRHCGPVMNSRSDWPGNRSSFIPSRLRKIYLHGALWNVTSAASGSVRL